MPELPEMETYRTLLSQKLLGKTITKVEVNRIKSINVPVEMFVQNVMGHKIIHIERRAKHLIFHLDNGWVLILHLMLGGWMYYGTEQDMPKRTVQIELVFGSNSLYFIGLRLGYLHLMTKEAAIKTLSDIGPEPIGPSFSASLFRDMVADKRGTLKPTLVDQDWIAGIGNCYSDEICFEAEILPSRKCDDLADEEITSLYESIQTVLQDATRAGGYMDHPLFSGDCLTGGYEKIMKVYDREGKPCPRCNSQIKRDEISSRKAFYCVNCQH